MPFNIFYSWQAKRVTTYNRNFIEKCLKDAIKQLKKEMKDESPDYYLDRDTKDIPGRPNIPTTIEEKIRNCDVFVGDVTYVAYINTNQERANRSIWDKVRGRNKWVQEGVYSTNVAEELGIANGALKGSERIVTVMNTAYGTPDQLNFDSKQFKFPLTYHYDEKTTPDQVTKEKDKLVGGLKQRIKKILESNHERQKEHFYPFVTWKTWETLFTRPFPFEKTEYIQQLFQTIKEYINTPKTIFRLCGLSGIGKTRMLFECFLNPETGHPDILANKILYVDVNEQSDSTIINKVKQLIQLKENKILIVDNCSKDLHNTLAPLIENDNSELSIITVSTDPEEKVAELDAKRNTRLMILQNQSCKEIVTKILANNFKGLHEDEQKLLVDFSSGVSFVATLMAENPDRGQYQPGTLTQENVVKRLLGPLFTDEISKAVIYACSLFSKIGFSDELEHQIEKISLDNDLFNVKTDHLNPQDVEEWRKNKFKEICRHLLERQLLEKKGRTYTFRPSPLAVRMAEVWWKDCTVEKFKRILPVLKEVDLIESFCEQFRYLKHVENAQAIVKNLCDDFFSSAEVLNTAVGSRLFRSFVYVNPIACSSALNKAFLNLPKEELEKIKEGRRNLVWALEKLCFRPETFIESTKVMATFSIAENENYGNNATNQFRQLFHIQLPGTAANLDERWKIIEFCFNNNEDYQSLGVQALGSALTVAHFSRMGGAEEQGDSIPLEDYKPSGQEVYQYWQKAINKLEKLSQQQGPFKERAVAILKEQFYGLCAQGAGKLIIPVIASLITTGQYNRMEARTQIQFILNSGRVFEKKSIEELEKMLEDLYPKDFSEKFKITVQSPSYEEYVDDESENSHGQKLASKIDKLSLEFIQQKDKWNEIIDSFLIGHIAEGFNFGKSIANQISSSDVKELLDLYLKKIKTASTENRNISIPIGILSAYKDKELARTVFHKLLDDEQLKYMSFAIAKAAELPATDFASLLDYAEKGDFPTTFFGEFMYGWGLRHLPQEELIDVLQRMRKLKNGGNAIAFLILASWTNGDKEAFSKFSALLREMIMQDSDIILSHLQNSMDIFYYSETVSKILNEKEDKEVAKKIIEVIIDEANHLEHYYSKENNFRKLLNILQEKYFPILWEAISKMYLNIEEYGLAAFHFKQLLGSQHDYNYQSEGLLFGGDSKKFEIIFEWCKINRERELYWIAELLPIFDTVRSEQSNWHPYALKFIDEFGEDEHFLSAISAKLGTYSWVGSVVPKLKSDKALFEKLLDHRNEKVRNWARIHIEDADKRIKWESNRDEEGIL